MRSFLLVSCLALLACALPAPASAGVPSPANASMTPAWVPVIGHDAGGTPDPIGEVTIVDRDLANNPVAGALIVLDFSACTELRLCAASHDPNVFVDCATRTVRALTDANGVAKFRVMGWSTAAPGGPGAGYLACRVYADGVQIFGATAAIYDLMPGGLAASDLSCWLSDFFNAPQARDDYDGSGTVSASDLSGWLKTYFANGSTTNCTPEGPCP